VRAIWQIPPEDLSKDLHELCEVLEHFGCDAALLVPN
jgi:hypothetical protein